MIFKQILFALAILSFFSCERKETQTKLQAESVNRKIKRVTESIHDPQIVEGKIECANGISENTFVTSALYNLKGWLLQESKLNSRGSEVSKIVYKYDDAGNCIEIKFYDDAKLTKRKEIKFNNNNELIENMEFDSYDKIVTKQETIVDGLGGNTLITYQLVNSGFIKSQESIFNASENRRITKFFTDEKLVSVETKLFDTNQKLVEISKLYSNKADEMITRYEYDDKGNRIGTAVLQNNLVTKKIYNKYDQNNNVVETVTFGMRGNPIKNIKNVYGYDSENNWTKQVILKNGKPLSVILRSIEYF